MKSVLEDGEALRWRSCVTAANVVFFPAFKTKSNPMMYLPIWASVTKNAHAGCLGKLASDSGISDERWRLFIFPDRASVGLPVQQRDLHKAKLLIASLRGGDSS